MLTNHTEQACREFPSKIIKITPYQLVYGYKVCLQIGFTLQGPDGPAGPPGPPGAQVSLRIGTSHKAYYLDQSQYTG